MKVKLVKLFLRLSTGVGFLSAVADRFGLWSKELAVWGNWDNFFEIHPNTKSNDTTIMDTVYRMGIYPIGNRIGDMFTNRA